MNIIDFLQILLLFIVAVVNIVFFCKMWQMTNNVAEILNIMKKSQHKDKPKVEVPIKEGDDIRIWTKNNMRVKVTGIGKQGLLCRALDGSDCLDYIPEKELSPLE